MIDTKHLLVTFRYPWRRRLACVRYNRRARSVCMQVGPLEVVVWR